jgi:hypothetical protein
MKKAIALGGLAALALACLLATAPGNAGGKDDPAATASPFKGRVSAVGTSMNKDNVYVLLDARVERLGDRHFLVGTNADSDDPNDGKVVWIPIDVVLDITEFADIEQLEKDWPRAEKSY